MNERKRTIKNLFLLRRGTAFFVLASFSLLLLLSLNACKTSKSTTSTSGTTTEKTKTKKLSEDDEIKFKNAFIDACKQKSIGNVELAEGKFRECLKIDPNNAAAHYELASIQRFGGLFEEALIHSKAAYNGDQKNEWYALLYIECLHNKKMYNEAAAAYEKLVKDYPNKIDYYRELAGEYVYAENYQKAIKTYDKIGEKFGKTAEIYLAKIKLLRQLKKNEEAEAELKKLIEEYPGESNYYTYLAEIYQSSGQQEKAMEVYKKLLQIDPNNPYVHLALADFYRSQQKDKEFLEEVKIAFKNPDLEIDQKVKILISFYTLSDQYPEYKKDAMELCEILVNVHPDEAKSHTVYADYLYRDKRLREARDQYVLALKYEKGKFSIWNQVMIIESELRDNTALETHSKEAADLFPSQPLPLYFNGHAKIQLKKYKEAIDPLLEAKEYVIDNNSLLTQIFASLGDAYNYAKEYEKSDKAFEDALKLDPDNTYILNNHAYFLGLRKAKLEKAEKYAARANELSKDNASYMDTYGWILFQSQKYAEAKTWLEKAIKTGGEKNGVVLEHYGDVLFKLNETEKALEYWKKAKETGRSSEFIDKKILEKKLNDN